ncbi:protein diaphanous homolog 1-like [Octopus sinensis]|uniref:Protein diaphanous homolog 1-like n=1 Tax=Octopus sinensis TaxID=2607531 RepID=A0A7E6EHT9_9MOLL|nr:protein diaphanous homolog 1-like [Octopus sinensis]
MNLAEEKRHPLREQTINQKKQMIRLNNSRSYTLSTLDPAAVISDLRMADHKGAKRLTLLRKLRVNIQSNKLQWIKSFGREGLIMLLSLVKKSISDALFEWSMCLQLINALVTTPDDWEFRHHLRAEFMRLGLGEMLDKCMFSTVDMCLEMLKKSSQGSTSEKSLTSILQHLIFIRDEPVICELYMKLIECCVGQIVLRKNNYDPDPAYKLFDFDMEQIICNFLYLLQDSFEGKLTENERIIEKLKTDYDDKLSTSLTSKTEAETNVSLLEAKVNMLENICRKKEQNETNELDLENVKTTPIKIVSEIKSSTDETLSPPPSQLIIQNTPILMENEDLSPSPVPLVIPDNPLSVENANIPASSEPMVIEKKSPSVSSDSPPSVENTNVPPPPEPMVIESKSPSVNSANVPPPPPPMVIRGKSPSVGNANVPPPPAPMVIGSKSPLVGSTNIPPPPAPMVIGGNSPSVGNANVPPPPPPMVIGGKSPSVGNANVPPPPPPMVIGGKSPSVGNANVPPPPGPMVKGGNSGSNVPPPPPFGMSGGNAPPPPMGNVIPNLVLPFGMKSKPTYPTTQPPTKRLNWDKVRPQTFKEESVWTKMNDENYVDDKLLEKTLQIFASKPNATIMFGQLRKSPDEIKQAFLAIDSPMLTLNLVEQFIKNLPSNDQLEMLKEIREEIDDLQDCEQCLAVAISSVTAASSEVVKSNKLSVLLNLILSVGNILNANSRNSDTYGFNVTFLTKARYFGKPVVVAHGEEGVVDSLLEALKSGSAFKKGPEQRKRRRPRSIFVFFILDDLLININC